MCIFPKQNDIVSVILKGVKTAKCDFTHWTAQELFLTKTITKILTIYIFQEIAKIKNNLKFFMDTTVTDILKCPLSKRDNFRKIMEIVEEKKVNTAENLKSYYKGIAINKI